VSLTLYLRCKDFPQVDLSKWAKPKSDDETEMEKEPVVVACVWVTKAKAVDCSNLDWFVSTRPSPNLTHYQVHPILPKF